MALDLPDHATDGFRVVTVADAGNDHQVGLEAEHVVLHPVLVFVILAAGAAAHGYDDLDLRLRVDPLQQRFVKGVRSVVADAVAQHHDAEFAALLKSFHGFRQPHATFLRRGVVQCGNVGGDPVGPLGNRGRIDLDQRRGLHRQRLAVRMKAKADVPGLGVSSKAKRPRLPVCRALDAVVDVGDHLLAMGIEKGGRPEAALLRLGGKVEAVEVKWLDANRGRLPVAVADDETAFKGCTARFDPSAVKRLVAVAPQLPPRSHGVLGEIGLQQRFESDRTMLAK